MEQQHEPLWGDSEIANVASLMPTKREAAIMVEILRKRRDQYEAKLSALRAQAQPPQQPLDFPDGPGVWAFEGQRRRLGDAEELRRVYQVTNYVPILNEKHAPFPAIQLAEDRTRDLWHGKFYPNPPEGIGGQVWIGKWYRLTMPWDAQPPQQPMNANELLPCPFCGGQSKTEDRSDINPAWLVYCDRCEAVMDVYFRTQAEAAEAWNRRAQPPAPQPVPDAVRHVLQKALEYKKGSILHLPHSLTKEEQTAMIGEIDNTLSWLAQQP